MSDDSVFRRPVAWSAALVISACAAVALAAENTPLEYLDEETVATVIVVRKPLVFAFIPPDRPNARDYVTLAAAAVNRRGKIDYLLIGYFWSLGLREGGPPAVEPLVLQADDRRIQLPRVRAAHGAGVGVPVHRPPFGAATPYVYAVDLSTLRFVAESRQLALHIESVEAPVDYKLFEDRRGALKSFVGSVSGKD